MSAVNRDKIIEFFNKNPNPPDALFHEFHEKEGYDHAEAEAEAYKLATTLVRFLKNGRSVKDGITTKDVDPKELAMGVMVELEHTDDLETATRISLDHLAEFDTYYTALKKMEDSLKLEKKAFKLRLPSIVKDRTTPTIIEEYHKNNNEKTSLRPVYAGIAFTESKNKAAFIESMLQRGMASQMLGIIKNSSAKPSYVSLIMNDIEKSARIKKMAAGPQLINTGGDFQATRSAQSAIASAPAAISSGLKSAGSAIAGAPAAISSAFSNFRSNIKAVM